MRAVPLLTKSRAVCLTTFLLLFVTAVVYAPVRSHQFLNFDDNAYVTENSHVRAGLTWDGVVWAFTSPHGATWHPLTGLSHMLDCQLWGLDAGKHLRTNVILHLGATLLLLLWLYRATQSFWRSATVAALFALHPLHVESVAWVAERKDVLSGVLWMLTLLTYTEYARRPEWRRYALVLVAYVLALLAKPMVVTLPMVLLLLDIWPLRRREAWRRLVLEKTPLLVLAALDSIITYWAQSSRSAVADLETYPLLVRIGNGLIAYATYVSKTVWPVDLAVFYPHPAVVSLGAAMVAFLFLLGTTAAVLWQAKKRPYLFVGWFWYLGVLVPVIGIIKVGDQAMADRFTYLPHVGLFVAAVWLAADAARRWHMPRAAGAAVALIVVALCATATRRQLAYWQDSETLFRHALAVTRDNALAHTNLGALLFELGAIADARPHLMEAIRIRPTYAKAQLNRGLLAAVDGQADAAIGYYNEALRLEPEYAPPYYNLGILSAERGEYETAIRQYREAIRRYPDYAKAYNNLGWAIAAEHRFAEAIPEYEAALRIDPNLAAAHNNLAIALEETGQVPQAVRHYEEGARLLPHDARPLFNLALALRQIGRGAEATARLRECRRIAEANDQKAVAEAARQQLGE